MAKRSRKIFFFLALLGFRGRETDKFRSKMITWLDLDVIRCRFESVWFSKIMVMTYLCCAVTLLQTAANYVFDDVSFESWHLEVGWLNLLKDTIR